MKKISKEHQQSLLYNFEKDEKINIYFLVYTCLNIIFTLFFYICLGLSRIALIIIFLVFVIIIVSYKYVKPLSLRLNRKKNQMIKCRLRLYLITGKKEKNNKLEKILDSLKLTERQYEISQLFYISYLLIIFSIEFFILYIFNKILVLINPSDYDITKIGIFFSVEFAINLLLLLFQVLRYLSFKNIRKIREFINQIVIKELTKLEKYIERGLDLKLSKFKFNSKRILKVFQKWSDLYLGSYFVGLRKKLLISDYKSLIYTIGNEIYYYNLFNDLKFKLEESRFFHPRNEAKNNKIELSNIVYKIIEINIKRLNTSIQSRLLEKNERRTKIRMYNTFIAIVSISLSIIFTLSNLPKLIGF